MVNLKTFNLPEAKDDPTWKTALSDANSISEFIKSQQAWITKLNAPGKSSKELENFLEPELLGLGYDHEPKEIYPDRALIPDYVKMTDNGGIILEVERGKILWNNMDLLDFWKCHIHNRCNYLILIVPMFLIHSDKTPPEKAFEKVSNRLEAFFKKGCETRVRGLIVVKY